MALSDTFNLFGFQIFNRKKNNEVIKGPLPSFLPPDNSDGALTISSAAYYGTYLDLDGNAKNEIELITRYREMSSQHELESAIDDVVNEAIVQNDDGVTIKINLDQLKDVGARVKKSIEQEFNTIQVLLNYKNLSADIFRRWYIDGRIFYNIILDNENPNNGIQELRYIDPRKIRKIKELQKSKDANTGIDIITVANEYYIYNDKTQLNNAGGGNTGSLPGIRIAKDSIVNVNSGLMDSRRATVLSYLHKSIKPLNQLRMMEDATVIYRISRAPERRIFNVDVGNLPKIKADQVVQELMTQYKNKVVYDAETGQVRDDRKYLSMLEDFWLPKRGDGSKGTEIDTLSGGQNLGVMEDVIYFQKKLYKSLNVPISRLNPDQDGFMIGRPAEITRDELKFSKFISRLRNRFADLFRQTLRIQCILKGICTPEEWDIFQEKIDFDFMKDNYFTELKEGEILKERLGILGIIAPYTGVYYSKEWIMQNVLRMTKEDIEEQKKQIQQEQGDDDQNVMPNQIPQNDMNPADTQNQQQNTNDTNTDDQDYNRRFNKIQNQ